jgi:hypothetical protein
MHVDMLIFKACQVTEAIQEKRNLLLQVAFSGAQITERVHCRPTPPEFGAVPCAGPRAHSSCGQEPVAAIEHVLEYISRKDAEMHCGLMSATGGHP